MTLKSRTYLIGLSLIFLVTIVIYYPSLFVGFMFDDWGDLGNAYKMNLISWWKEFSPLSPIWRSMAYMTWFLEAELFGFEPLYYHIAHLILHGINIFLVSYLTLKLTRNYWSALGAALFFAMAKALVTPVVWCSAAIDQKLVLFGIPSLLLYIKSRNQEGSFYRKKWIYLLGSYVLFYLTLKSKLLAVAFPAAYVLYDLFYKTPKNKKEFYRFVVELVKHNLVIWVLLILFAVGNFAMPAEGEYGVTLSPINYLQSFRWYFSNAVFNILQDGVAVFMLVTLCLLGAVFLKSRAAIFGFCWFAITIIPVAILKTHHFEHHLYLPIVGLAIMFSDLIVTGLNRFIKSKKVLIAISFLLCVFYIRTNQLMIDDFIKSAQQGWLRTSQTLMDLKTIGSNLSKKETNFIVYPRPASSLFDFDFTLRIVFGTDKKNFQFKVYDNETEFNADLEAAQKNPQTQSANYYMKYDPTTGALLKVYASE